MRRRSGTLFRVLAVMTALQLGAGVGGAFAAFTASPSSSHSIGTAALAAPTNLAITGDVILSWTATTSGWSTGTKVFRSKSSGGPYTQLAAISGLATTTYSDSPGAGTFSYMVESAYTGNGANWTSPASTAASLQTTTFVFKTTSGFTLSGNCDTSTTRERDMQQNFVPSGTEETLARVGSASIDFCSDTFNTGAGAGETMAAGTTTVSAYVNNSAGSGCTLTAALTKNGSTTLGSGAMTVPGTTPLGLQSWSFATSTTTFAAGDRLGFTITWQGVKACDSTTLHYGGTTSPSSVTVPAIA